MDNKITIEPIFSIMTTLWKFRVLSVAIKLNVFDVLERFSDIEKVATNLKVNADSLERLLNALVAMEFVEKKGGSYFNKPISSKFLKKSSAEYYGNFILMHEASDDSWKKLDEVIRTGSPIAGSNKKRLAQEEFTKAMHDNARAPAKALSKLVDFGEKKHLLDIGGGSGAFSIILTNKYKNLKATVIEQPKVCAIVKKYVETEGDSDRVRALGGDYSEVEFPAHDVALFGQVFHSNAADLNRLLLKKVFDKIDKGGIVVITEFLLDEDKTGPLFSTLFSLNMLKQTKNGRAYTFSEIKLWLEELGFRNIEKQHLVGSHTAIFAHK